MHMIFNDVEIDSNQYFEVANSLYDLKEKVCNYFNITMSQLRWFHVMNYLKDTGKVIFQYGYFSKEFNGKTRRIDKNHILTMLNTNEENNDGRKHFTAMHEVTHSVLHLDGALSNKTFYSNSANDVSSDLKEIQADIGASELLMTSEAIYQACCSHQTFRNMCNTFEVSYGALNTRLLNYLVFEKNMYFPLALKLVTNFRYRNNQDLEWYIQYCDSILSIFDDVQTETYGEYSNGFDGYNNYIKSCYPTFWINVSASTVYLVYQQYLSLKNPSDW